MERFEELAAQYEPMLHKIMRDLHIYKNKEDFLQLGLISLWEAWENFDPERGNFTNYAYSYIKGKFKSEMTKTNKYEERMFYPKDKFWEYIVDPATPEAPFEVKFILSFCKSLTPNQTKWVLYTLIDDLSIAEIAERENVSISAVKAWRKGAKHKLQGRLEIIDD